MSLRALATADSESETAALAGPPAFPSYPQWPALGFNSLSLPAAMLRHALASSTGNLRTLPALFEVNLKLPQVGLFGPGFSLLTGDPLDLRLSKLGYCSGWQTLTLRLTLAA